MEKVNRSSENVAEYGEAIQANFSNQAENWQRETAGPAIIQQTIMETIHEERHYNGVGGGDNGSSSGSAWNWQEERRYSDDDDFQAQSSLSQHENNLSKLNPKEKECCCFLMLCMSLWQPKFISHSQATARSVTASASNKPPTSRRNSQRPSAVRIMIRHVVFVLSICFSLVHSLSSPLFMVSSSTSVSKNYRPSSQAMTTRTITLNQKKLDALPKFPRTWVPLASIFELDPHRPNPVKFLGQNYVIYRASNHNDKQRNLDLDPKHHPTTMEKWVVVDDVCPHRLAPLSEGRIDRSNTTASEFALLECSYHGWTFDCQGTNVRLPQATDDVTQAARENPQCHLHPYPVQLEKNIVWAWLWSDDVLSPLAKPSDWEAAQPQWMVQNVPYDVGTYTRDLPYGWDTLVENLADAGHVPFVRQPISAVQKFISVVERSAWHGF